MSGRTPSFIVVGLVIIMFLLGLFYMSCSSKNTELRLSLEQFEDRIRSLTIKNSDIQKKMEDISARKRELEEEKVNVEKQMGKKDSEINDLNTKLNEKTAEVESLKSDKNVASEQLKEFKTLRETVAEKTALVEKLQQEIQELKQSGNNELTRLRQDYESLKTNHSNNNNNTDQQNVFKIPSERFPPLLSKNQTSRGLSALFQEPYNKLNNLTRDVRAEIVPAVIDVKNKVFNAIGINTNSSISAANNTDTIPDVGQNIPPPPAVLLDKNIQSINTQNRENQLGGDNPRLLRSSDNKNADDEVDDEEKLDANNAQESFKLPSNSLKGNDQENLNNNNNNYRIGNRGQEREIRNQQRIDNGEEIDHDDENVDINQGIRKRSVR